MGTIYQFTPQKLVTGFLFSSSYYLEQVLSTMTKEFGPIDYQSRDIAFTFTKYYEKEMGGNLHRRFVSFEPLVDPSQLAEIKIKTNDIEEHFSAGLSHSAQSENTENSGRCVNIDPGLLCESKLLLASTKDHAHRVPLNNGIYAELTLMYRNKQFESMEWTFPDYRTPEYHEILTEIREIYRRQLKQMR